MPYNFIGADRNQTYPLTGIINATGLYACLDSMYTNYHTLYTFIKRRQQTYENC